MFVLVIKSDVSTVESLTSCWVKSTNTLFTDLTKMILTFILFTTGCKLTGMVIALL